MDDRHDTRPRIGMNVIDRNDHLVGTVESVEHDHFVVGKGLFFAQPQRIPDSAIGEIRGQKLRLRITRETALHSSVDLHWDERPEHGEIVELLATDDVPQL
jgi:hypothetical protein